MHYSAVKDFVYMCYQRKDEDMLRMQLVKDGDTYIFKRRHDIYVHNLRDEYDIIRNKHVHMSIVGQNKDHLALKEIKRVEEAVSLQGRLSIRVIY